MTRFLYRYSRRSVQGGLHSANLAASVINEAIGETIPARVHVVDSTGRFAHPSEAILKVGPGVSFFYADGFFKVDLSRGPSQITVECDTKYVPAQRSLDVPAQGIVAAEIVMSRWSTLGERNWHPCNTHIHYDEKETHPGTNVCDWIRGSKI